MCFLSHYILNLVDSTLYIQFYELPLIGTIITSIFKVMIFLPNILILWRKFRAEGEIFYGINGTNEIDEECGYSEFREFKEALRLMRTKETIGTTGTTTKLKHQKNYNLYSLCCLYSPYFPYVPATIISKK